MNATNRPVDILLNIETVKSVQPLQRGGRSNDVSALKQKENSFDNVYRQQRRDDASVRQQERNQERPSQQNQRTEKAAETARKAQPLAAKTPKNAESKPADGKALPHAQTPKTETAKSELAEQAKAPGFELAFASQNELDADINVQFGALVDADTVQEEIEQLELGLNEGVQTTDVINTQAQVVNVAKTETESAARAGQPVANVPEILKDLKQSRLGGFAEGALNLDVNNGAQAKPVTGNLVELDGQVKLQDRFAQLPLGQELKLLREQVKAGSVTTGAEKVAATETAKSAESGDRLARLNTLTQAAQTLSARPGTVTTSVQPPVGSPDWSQAVSQRITWLVNRGISAAELQLNPRELGPVDVRINMSGEQATVQFTSQHAAVREALESSVVRLREMLENSGLNLADVDVSDQSQSEQAQAEAREGGIAESGDERDEVSESIEAQTAQRIETDSLIDLHA